MSKINDVFTIIRNGANIKQGASLEGFPITRIETISNGTIDRNKMGYAGIFDLDKYYDYILQTGDILMSHINSENHLGKTAIYNKYKNESIIHGMNLLMLRSNRSILYPKYALYYFKSNKFKRQLPSITKKSVNQASFTTTDLKELEIDIIPIKEQQEISQILDKINDLILLKMNQIQKLDLLVKSQFARMFGKVGKEANLIDYVWFQEGPGVRTIDFTQEGTILLTGSNINDNNIIFGIRNDRHISNELANGKYKHFICDKNDILVVSSAIDPDKFDKKVVIVQEDKKYCLNTGIIRFKPNSEFLTINYFKEFLKTDYFKNQVVNKMRGIAQMHFGPSHLRTMKILLPNSIKLQNNFETFVKQIDKQKFELQKNLNELNTLNNALMQKYFE